MTVDFDRRVEAFSSYNIDVDEAHSPARYIALVPLLHWTPFALFYILHRVYHVHYFFQKYCLLFSFFSF